MDCKISKIVSDDNRPLIAKFLNGKLDIKNDELCTKLLKGPDNKIVSEINGHDTLFTGSIIEESSKKTYLLIRRKNSNKVKLLHVDHAILSPYMPQTEDVVDTSITEENTTMRELYKEFGSKKAKRRTEHIERMKMDVENVRNKLEQTVADREIEDVSFAPPKTEEVENSYRPPINRNASTKEQVYELHKLIPKSVLDSLENDAKSILESDLDQFELNPIIKNALLILQKTSISESIIEKCEVLLYADCLISFNATPIKRVTKAYSACSYSADVNNHIMSNFSSMSGNARTRSLSMKDKSVCYIMVLLMIALGYKLSIEDVAKETKMGLKKVQEVGRVLGFTVSGNMFTIKIPLPPPVINSSDRKRKRK